MVQGRFGARRLIGPTSVTGGISIDLAHCPNCGGELKIIAAILDQSVIEKILMHLGLQARAPPRAPARGHALQAAWPSRSVTVQATRRPGPRGSAASGLRRTEAKGPSG
jgi:hypothetical protein